MPFWTYMLHCHGGYFYVGHTDDLDRRIRDHKSGLIAGFTADHLPVELVWSDEFQTREDAKAAERKIKGWSRAKKLALIRGDWERISALAKNKDSASKSSAWTGKGETVAPKTVPPELVEGSSFTLRPHPDTPCLAVRSITATAKMSGPDSLNLTFEIVGKIEQVLLSPTGQGIRKDRLWEHTCFEMFSRNINYEAYEELNLSPSTDWACYDFDSYRNSRSDEEYVLAPEISTECSASIFRLFAQAALAEGAGPWLVGFSAVIEEVDGTKSYWALAHPPGKPDFHHPACFAATLPPPIST
jgi:predicted GIY-YIG superfamily endonuclease